MCTNSQVAYLECYIEDMIDCFEDFVKKSLLIITTAVAVLVGMLLFLLRNSNGLSGHNSGGRSDVGDGSEIGDRGRNATIDGIMLQEGLRARGGKSSGQTTYESLDNLKKKSSSESFIANTNMSCCSATKAPTIIKCPASVTRICVKKPPCGKCSPSISRTICVPKLSCPDICEKPSPRITVPSLPTCSSVSWSSSTCKPLEIRPSSCALRYPAKPCTSSPCSAMPCPAQNYSTPCKPTPCKIPRRHCTSKTCKKSMFQKGSCCSMCCDEGPR